MDGIAGQAAYDWNSLLPLHETSGAVNMVFSETVINLCPLAD